MKLALLSFAAALASYGQQQLGSASVGLEGLHVHIVTTGFGKQLPGGFSVQGLNTNSLRREIKDSNGRVLFAYIVEVEKLAAEKRVRVLLKPVEAPTPSFSAPRELPVMWFGDKAAVDVLSNPVTGDKITDTLEVREGPMAVRVPGRYALGLYQIRVKVNGELVGERSNSTVQSNGIVMFFIEGRGSYFFSTKPVPGWNFAKIGVVDRNRLTFQINNENYEVVSVGQILADAPQGDLWVLHDTRAPTWRTSRDNPMSIGGGDKMEDFYRD